MAKRRASGGGGSSIGLIITLIFFICTTIALGVTTYLGYSELAQYETVNEKAKKAVTADKKDGYFNQRLKAGEDEKVGYLVSAKYVDTLIKEIEWYKFQAQLYRAWMGYPYKGGDAALAIDKAAFAKGGVNAAKHGAPPDAEDVKQLVALLDKEMQWDAPANDKEAEEAVKRGKTIMPAMTYKDRLDKKDAEVGDARKEVAKLEAKVEKLNDELKTAKADLQQAQATFNANVDKIEKAAAADLATDRALIKKLQKDLNDASEAKNEEKEKTKKAEVEAGELKKTLKEKDDTLANVTKDKTEAVTALTSVRDQLDVLKKRLKEDEKTLSDRALDAEALKVLKNWPQSKMRWKIIRIDQKGDKPYINLGSGDGLETGMTFSVHSMGRDGKLTPLPKGTVEVIELLRTEPRLARVRVTSVTDPKNDPIVAGDHLFNPTFSPGAPKRVAIAGLADLGGEGTDSSVDLRRLLKRQGVIVDAYVNTKDDKEPRLLKEGDDAKGEVTSKTTYLIIADGLEVVPRHPKRNDKDYIKKYNELISEMQDKARQNGVTVISLSRYLDMIGYKPPKVISTRQR